MPEWLQWAIYLAGATIALQGLIIAAWALFRDRAAGRRRCPKCWYDMAGTPPAADVSFTCPECGKRVRSERGLQRTRRRYRRALLGLFMTAIGIGANAEETIRRIRWWSHVPTYVIIALAPYADDLPRSYEPEFESRVISYQFDGTRAMRVAKPLPDRSSRLLGRVAFRIVRDQPNHPLHRELIGCLGLSDANRDEVQKLLLNLILSPDTLTREYAARSLLDFGPDPDAVLPRLLEALATYPATIGTSRDPWRTFTIRTIGGFGPRAKLATEVLIAELSSVIFRDGDVAFGYDVARERATIQALGRIGPPAAAVLPRLHATDEQLESYRGDDYEERIAELLISGECKSETEARAALFAHPIWRVRRAAAGGTWFDRFDQSDVPLLLKALNDESAAVRQTAAETLLRHNVERDAAYQSLLRPDSGQSDAWTRVQIMWRFELDPKPVLPQLEADLVAAGTGVYGDNLRRMIDVVKSGVRPKNGNF